MIVAQHLHQGSLGGESCRCGHPGCQKTTREAKPFCPEHVEEHPYVKEIIAHLEQRVAEKKLAAENKLEDHCGQLAGELIHLLRGGERTIERVSRELRLTNKEARGACQCLQQAGLAVLGRTVGSRGSVTIFLINQRQRA